jgi:hypothetical protein
MYCSQAAMGSLTTKAKPSRKKQHWECQTVAITTVDLKSANV